MNEQEREAQQSSEPLGYMNAGHLHEMREGRLPYGYIYPNEAPGVHIPVYAHAAACRQAAEPEAQQPIGQLFQHGETGRTRVVMQGDVADCDAAWFKVGDLVLAGIGASGERKSNS